MIIDQNKIDELLQKEVSLQVEKKLKTFGRESIKDVYKQAVKESVDTFLKGMKSEIEGEINEAIKYDTDTWKEDITASVSERLVETISKALREEYYRF